VVLPDFRVDQFAPDRLQRHEGAFLILAHQPRITGDIGREDRRQPPLDASLRHYALPPPTAATYHVLLDTAGLSPVTPELSAD
jgi:hypothetical protein